MDAAVVKSSTNRHEERYALVTREPATAVHASSLDEPPVPHRPCACRSGAFVVDVDDERSPTSLRVKLSSTVHRIVPEDQSRLAVAVQGMASDLESLFSVDGTRHAEKARYLVRLRTIAETGLTGASPQVTLAHAGIEAMKHEIVFRQAGFFKNRALRRFGHAAGRVAGGSLAIAAAALAVTRWTGPSLLGVGVARTDLARIGNAGLLTAACAAGAWLSAATRRPTLVFCELVQPDERQLSPWVRLAVAELLTVTLAVLSHVGAIALQIGHSSTQQVFVSPAIAVLLGVLGGLGEQATSTRVVAQVGALFQTQGAQPSSGEHAAAD